jgi:predicted amidohydrolase YtcJ
MHKPYSDKPANTALCWQPISGLKDVAKQIAASKFQLNTHAMGDSANTVILKIYEMFWLEPKIEDGN